MTAPAVPPPRCQDDGVIGAEALGGDLVRQIQEMAHRRMIPLNASIELTLNCNIRCRHCYNFDRDQQTARDLCAGDAASELSLDEVFAVMQDLRDAGCLFLALTGGEVLTYPHLFQVLDRARELNLAVQILSNGTLLRPGVAARLASYRNLAGMSISIYGATPEVHDGVTQVQGSWRRTWDGVARLRAAGIAVRLKLIVMRDNAHEVAAMRAMADARGVPYLVDLTITSRHDGSDSSLATRVTDAQLEMLYRGALRDLVPSGNQPTDEDAFRCNCARGNCAITARGDVQPCIAVPWRAGNIREQPFAEIWRTSPVFQQIRGLKLADYPSCGPCPDKAYCTHSRSAAYNATGSYMGADPFVCTTAALTKKIASEAGRAAAAAAAPDAPGS